MTVRRAVGALAVALAAAPLAGACGGDGSGTTVTVLAAASLTGAFTDLGDAFEARAGDDRVEISFGASSTLREQILEGAPADLFAPAAQEDAAALDAAGLVRGRPPTIATNTLEIAVPPGNPAGITGLADLARGELLLGLCAAPVPCGRLARLVLDDAGVLPALDTEAPDVRALLTQVEVGELDAAIVYRTDVEAAAVEGVEIPPGDNVVTTLPLVTLEAGPAPGAAARFVAFVRSAEGQEILARHGFGPP